MLEEILSLWTTPGDAKKEYVIHMSNILKGNCDIIKGRKLYVAFKKGDKRRKEDRYQI